MATRARSISRYLTISATQGSADAFVQGSVATGIVAADGLALKVLSIEFLLVTSLSGLAADCVVNWGLTRDTKTALATLSDVDTILFDGWSLALTTSGTERIPALYRYTAQEGIYLVEPNIYMQIDSTATALQLTGEMRVYYEEVELSEVDILRVLTNS